MPETYSFSCYLLTEPSAPPSNVSAHSESSTSIFVSWGEVPFQDQNGVIVNYTVTYKWLPSGPAQTWSVSASVNQTTVTGLNEFSNYSIAVFALTAKGGGNQSTPIVVITDEDSKFVITQLLIVLFEHYIDFILFQVIYFTVMFGYVAIQ